MKVKELIEELQKYNQDFRVMAIKEYSHNGIVTHYKPFMTNSIYLISKNEEDELDES